MNAQYLLPCSCGRKIPVQLRQAGETATCECGASIEVPTLSGLKKLERAEAPAELKTVQHHWTLGHGLIFVGGLVILAGIGLGGWLFWDRPVDPYANFTPEQMKNLAEHLTPIGSLLLWQRLERSGLERHKRGAEIAYADMQAQYRVYWWILVPFVGIGVGLAAAGIIVLKLKIKKPRTAMRA